MPRAIPALLWCLAADAGAAPPGAGPAAAKFDLAGWQVDDGLPQASVVDIEQDPGGYLLAATFGGIARFDGSRFTVWDPSTVPGLPSARVTAIAAAPDGTLWVGTQFGAISRVRDGRAEPAPGPIPRSLGVVWDLLWRSDGLWAATEAGVLHLDGDRWTVWSDVGSTIDLADTGDAVWGAGRRGVIRVAEGRATVEALPAPGSVLAIASDPAGARVWVVTDAGLATLDATSAQLRATPEVVTGEAHPTEASILVDPRRRVWVGTDAALVLVGDADDVAAGRIAPTRWEIGSSVERLAADRDGVLWVGTGEHGLLRVTANPFERYGAGQGLPAASAIVVDASGPEPLVGAGCHPVSVLREGRFVPAGVGDGGCVRALLTEPGGVWVGEDDRVIPPAGSGIPPFEAPGRVLAIGRDPSGEVWIGTEGAGAWVLRGGAPVRVPEVGDGPVSVFAAAADGSWWMGLGQGVAVARGGQVTVRTDGMPRAEVRAILHDPDGTAWLGTYGGGLVRLRGDATFAFTTAQGLPENIASVVLDDGRGHLWMNGNRGVYRVSRDDAEDVAGGRAERLRAVRYATGEGNGGSAPAGGVDPRGRLWFATLQGVVSFDPRELPPAGTPPVAHVEEILVDGVAWPADGGFAAPPGPRNVSVRFTAATLRDPLLARFEYRLLPLDPTWRDAGESRVVRYAGLGPGDLEFEVRAANEDGVWSDVPARVSFSLAPHPSETTWFRALAVLAVAGTVTGGVTLRSRRAARHAAELRAEIDRRARVEHELRVRGAHYRRVFETTSDGLLVTDRDGRVTDANPAARALFGRELDALRGRELASLVDAEAGEGVGADASRFPARVETVPLEGDLALTTVVDLGPELALRARLAQAERVEAIGRLAGGVAHEFNNLLMVIRANAAEIEEAERTDPDAREGLRAVLQAADRGAALTQQLLLFGRRQLLRPVPIDAAAFVGQLETLLARLLRDDVVLRARCEPAWVLADPAQLELAVVHLVLQAADALPGGGRISLTVSPLSPEDAEVRWPGRRGAARDRDDPPARGWVRISVSDDGPGLPKEALDRLFEPFPPGAGEATPRLGLAGVDGFAAQSSGQLYASSAPGAGTCFDLLLPASEAQAPMSAPLPTPQPPARQRVLVCDDDPFVRRSVERLVQSGGYRVIGAGSGREALDLLAREGAEILVTDVLMPEMNGPELARRARRERPDLPVLFMSGYTRDVLPDDIEGELLNKPFTREGLLAAVRRALAGRDGQPPAG